MFITELCGAAVQLMLFSAIPFFWWLITARKEVSFFKWVGLKKVQPEGKTGITLLITAAAVAVYGLSMSFFIGGFAEKVTQAGSNFAGMGPSAVPSVIVYGFLRTGLAEEIVFRGFIGKRVSAGLGFAAGNTVQALLFGLLHGVPFGLATGNIAIAASLTLLPAAFGWFNGWLDEKRSGGSIVTSWLLHGLINTAVACMSL